MGLCGGAPKQKESAAEREHALQAAKKMHEWKTDGYRELETSAIADAKTDVSGKFKARANADAEQAAAGVPTTGNVRTLRDVVAGVTSAKRNVLQDAEGQAEGYQTGKKVAMAKVGQDVADVSNTTLSGAARRGGMKAATEVQNELTKSLALGNAIGSVVSGATAGYMSQPGGGEGLHRVDNRADRLSNGQIYAGGKRISAGAR